jgi:NTE family protein
MRREREGRLPRIGLVLGAGGVVGHAFHGGVLAALEDAAGWDARAAEVVCGTSAGSVVGALLRAGFRGTDIAARAVDAPMSDAAERLAAHAEPARVQAGSIPSRPPRGRRLSMSAPGALLRAAWRPWTVRPASLAAAVLPAGVVSTELVAAGLRPLFDGTWPEQSLWVNAVRLDTSQRVTFGRDTTGVDVATAVAASCAIPGFFEPVVIDGARYVDGGTHSPTNADVVANLGLDLVIVSSPMSIASNRPRLAPDQPFRRLARLTLAQEVARVRRHGTHVLVFQPTPEIVGVMGTNAMDPRRRGDVTRATREAASRRLERANAHDAVELLRAAA